MIATGLQSNYGQNSAKFWPPVVTALSDEMSLDSGSNPVKIQPEQPEFDQIPVTIDHISTLQCRGSTALASQFLVYVGRNPIGVGRNPIDNLLRFSQAPSLGRLLLG